MPTLKWSKIFNISELIILGPLIMTTLNYIKFALDRDDRDKLQFWLGNSIEIVLFCQICSTWVAGAIEIYSLYAQEHQLFQTGL